MRILSALILALVAALTSAFAQADMNVVTSCEFSVQTVQSQLMAQLASNPTGLPFKYVYVDSNGKSWPTTFQNVCSFKATLPDGVYSAQIVGALPNNLTSPQTVIDFVVRGKVSIVLDQTGSIAFSP